MIMVRSSIWDSFFFCEGVRARMYVIKRRNVAKNRYRIKSNGQEKIYKLKSIGRRYNFTR